jgi:phage tail-like protein
MAGTARSQSTDPYSLNKFHVVDTEGFLNLVAPAAGFQTCSMPDLTLENHEYSEGLWTYRRKFVGTPTFNDITMAKGVVRNDSSFFKWVMAAVLNKAYRTSLTINHYHRDDVSGLIDYTNAKPSRQLILMNAGPGNVKLGSDFDAMSSDISIEEVTVWYESLRMFINGVEVLPS